MNALANPEVGKYVNEHFVSAFQKVATFKIVNGQKQGGNVAAYFCAPDGRVTADANPNGSLRSIAGIANARGNVVGIMPHPERACEALLGSLDGLEVFRSAIHALGRVAV